MSQAGIALIILLIFLAMLPAPVLLIVLTLGFLGLCSTH